MSWRGEKIVIVAAANQGKTTLANELKGKNPNVAIYDETKAPPSVWYKDGNVIYITQDPGSIPVDVRRCVTTLYTKKSTNEKRWTRQTKENLLDTMH